jgi:hypothetical protein
MELSNLTTEETILLATGFVINFYDSTDFPELFGLRKNTCVLIQHHAMNQYWGSGGIAPRIL